jgi:RNA 2',3'-cyclic 3'-phosphodiesterase
MEKPIRTFIAFELPAHLVQLAAELQERLKGHGLRLRWVRPHNIHLTLKFLGEVAPSRMEAVAAGMQTAARGMPPLALTVEGMGIFPTPGRPRVLWIGLGGQAELLQQLHARLEAQLAPLGIKRERRPFKAHLTLARINHILSGGPLLQAIQEEGRFTPGVFQASELVLFKSDLRPQGAVYTPLARVLLGSPRFA